MKIRYKFEYDLYRAECTILVNTELFTEDKAIDHLNFFRWEIAPNMKTPIESAVIKHAFEAIVVASVNEWNAFGVKEKFQSHEGYYKLDGTEGLLLEEIHHYEFDETELEFTKETVTS